MTAVLSKRNTSMRKYAPMDHTKIFLFFIFVPYNGNNSKGTPAIPYLRSKNANWVNPPQ